MQIKEPKLTKIYPDSLFITHHHFMRSTHIERDWDDPAALENYICTPHAQQSLQRIAVGLNKSSSLRAWRITGDYGSGKSSFALLLANIFAKRTKSLPLALKKAIQTTSPDLFKSSQPTLIPILITGSREPLGMAILKALLRTLKEYKVHSNFYSKLEQIYSEKEAIDDIIVVDWVKRTQAHFVKTKKADGLFFVIDEAGKFLEYVAMRPDQQDVYLLQTLAETASRSGRNPLFVVSIFHQGISAYTEGLSKTQQKEWEKVAGRYEEIIWHLPVEQTVILVANSLNTQLSQVPKAKISEIKRDMQKALKLGWYGWSINQDSLQSIAEQLYPLHPSVIPVLVRLFSNFGQNERSLYSFLLGMEPSGLQEFVWKTEGKQFYQLYHLYDYARSTFGSRLGTLSYYWKAIDSVINSCNVAEELLQLLKAIGIINLINSDELLASNEILSLIQGEDVSQSLSTLQQKHYIHYRGKAGGYCVWPNTSVNLEDSYEQAKNALGVSKELKSLIRERLEFRPIVARRHYIETGNLRYFDVKYIDVNDLSQQLSTPASGDGQIIVPLCENLKDVQIATSFAESIEPNNYQNVLIAIPEPLQNLSSFIEEVRRWEWIERSIGELRQDRYAREEVTRQLNLSRQELQKHLHSTIGLVAVDNQSQLNWFYNGKKIENLNSGRAVMALLTEACNVTYPLSPHFHNELINRKKLSSAGASARLRLCERLFEFSDLPYLGMDSFKRPPEMSMYLSVLKEAGLHSQVDNKDYWTVRLPDEKYDKQHCRVLPVMRCIHEVLLQQPDKRVPVLKVFDVLRSAPYGVRDGMIPLLLAVFAVIHEQELAFYEDGSFIPRVTGSNFLRLIKAPETFELQYYPITGVRNTLFHRLVHELGFKTKQSEHIDLLDVVKPLVVFMGSLPEYVLKTSQISPQALSVRSVLLTTTDPVQLLFQDLPIACGLSPISHQDEMDSHEVIEFVDRLKVAIDDLRAAYPSLLGYIQKAINQEFGFESAFEKNRNVLAQRAKNLSGFITEIRLKSFCLRLADPSLSTDYWLESLGNLLCSMPPSKWKDRERDKFEEELHRLSNQFKRVEATIYSRNGSIQEGQSVRVSLTQPNGEERDQVIHLSEEQVETVQQLERRILDLLSQHGQVGMAAASRVMWQMMASKELEEQIL